ncbi:hypothetical protein P152DRAFT_398824 [Eremomyces bilateralis CBS 781.70]|uniref:Uncharacterized protein n=1 Tax=Eremomyces bilateralis CBS 781.70 TaxID=1392243 RepID=A0A6G1G161_9PEZI|nr:uncharacterized protein P152DRAFT_398824 [Eremomyces bilateralis CBS 781.70]KAF1811666.1 hypothetical protein P152DRAFT_398824 [Eremomyces bilateralis CBS 781.70]
MAVAHSASCSHEFVMIKSDTTIVLWNCNLCHSGPHWYIWECTKCKFKACRPCSVKA